MKQALWQVGTHYDITFPEKAACTCSQLMQLVELENAACVERIKKN
jgi:hypothetical protein